VPKKVIPKPQDVEEKKPVAPPATTNKPLSDSVAVAVAGAGAGVGAGASSSQLPVVIRPSKKIKWAAATLVALRESFISAVVWQMINLSASLLPGIWKPIASLLGLLVGSCVAYFFDHLVFDPVEKGEEAPSRLWAAFVRCLADGIPDAGFWLSNLFMKAVVKNKFLAGILAVLGDAFFTGLINLTMVSLTNCLSRVQTDRKNTVLMTMVPSALFTAGIDVIGQFVLPDEILNPESAGAMLANSFFIMLCIFVPLIPFVYWLMPAEDTLAAPKSQTAGTQLAISSVGQSGRAVGSTRQLREALRLATEGMQGLERCKSLQRTAKGRVLEVRRHRVPALPIDSKDSTVEEEQTTAAKLPLGGFQQLSSVSASMASLQGASSPSNDADDLWRSLPQVGSAVLDQKPS
jgi:hypothetical protein